MPEVVKPGSPEASIVEDEERVHAKVQARAAASAGVEQEERVRAADFDKELLELRDSIAEAKPEDLAPLVEQMTRLSLIRARLGGSQSLPIDIRSPYFAHMKLREDGRVRDILVGKRGFIDRKQNIQIVDWRNAPISQVYYRYDEGDDYEEEIAGRLTSGIVELRRNVSIQSSVLRRIGTPQGTFVRDKKGQWHAAIGDAAPVLMGGQGKAARSPAPTQRFRGRGVGRGRAAGRLGVHSGDVQRADKHLPEIAALIDAEQFELITQPTTGLVVIQGGAGSGKTTVALHRIAYLAFNDKSFRPSKMLFVVPTRALARYVSGVLPALGVRGVPVVGYHSWARKTRRRVLPNTWNDYNDHTPDAVSRIKKHPALIGLIADKVAGQVAAVGNLLEKLGRGGEDGAGVSAVLARWKLLEKSALLPRLRKLLFWAKRAELAPSVRVALEGLCRRRIRDADDIASDWAELLTDRDLLMRLRERGASAQDIEATLTWASRQLEDVGGDERKTADGRPIDEDSPAARYDLEDDPILLRFVQEKRGGLFDPKGELIQYKHVAIDEAQDRSALEVKVLLSSTEADDEGRRSVTIAGDTAQRLVFDNEFSGWEDLLEHTGQVATVRPLRLSYRSTAEVMKLARDILGTELAPDDDLVARSGEPVEIHEFGDAGEVVAFLADALRSLVGREPTASVAVLARHPEQADTYFHGLSRAEVPNLRRVRRDDFSFEPGVDVTEVSQVKGLEFDYVIMVDVNAATYSNANEARHLLHIGATRAAHQLWITTTGNPSPLLPES